MKTTNFLLSFVIFTFTAVTSVTAQTKQWSAVAQDETKQGAGSFSSGVEYVNWLLTGKTPSWVKPYDGCDAACQAEINAHGAAFSKVGVMAIIAAGNDSSHFFKDGPMTAADFTTEMWQKIANTLVFSDVDFQGNNIRNLSIGYNTKTGEYSPEWIEHANVGKMRSVLSKQNDKTFLVAKAACGQPFPAQESGMVQRRTATIVGGPSAGAPKPNSGPGNPGNGSGDGSNAGGSLTFEQLLELAQVMRQPIIVNAGNNNGNNNGGSITGGGSGRDGANGRDGISTQPSTPGYTDGQGITWTTVESYPINRQSQTIPGGQQQTWVQPSQNTTACGNCGTGYQLTQADVALGQKQGQIQIAQNDKTNRLLKTANIIGGINLAMNTISTGFEIADDFGAFNNFKVAPTSLNQFNSYSSLANNTTVDTNGNPVGFPNGGGQGNCPTGFHWDGTQCVQ